MKRFTKIALIVASVFFSLGLISVIGSFAMGLTWGTFDEMLRGDKFSFTLDDVGIKENHNDEQISSHISKGELETNFHSLDIEFGYGVLKIQYGDVENIQIEQKDVDKYRCYIEEGTLHIEGNQKMKVNNSNHAGEITIIVPKNMVFQEVDMEVGAGKADVIGLEADQVDIELGAGEMNVTDLDAKDFNAQTGAGKLYVELVGKQTDYSYELECGIGQLKIGDSSYSGLKTEQNISNPGAECFVDVECGVGEIIIEFQE